MNKALAIELAAAHFVSYPSVPEFFITSDGQAFADKQNAENHAVSLDKHSPVVVTVGRDEAEGQEVITTEEQEVTTEEKEVVAPAVKKAGKKK